MELFTTHLHNYVPNEVSLMNSIYKAIELYYNIKKLNIDKKWY